MSTYLSNYFFDVISNRYRLYWLLQACGWLGYMFFVQLGALLWDQSDAVHLAYTLVATLTGLLLSMAMREAFHKIWNKPPLPRGLLTLAAVMVATGLWALWKFYMFYKLYHHKEIENLAAEYIYWYSYSFFIFLSWAGLYYGVRFYQEIQQEREKNLRIASSAHQSQLKMLRYQLNPHFLFNTLNAISTLIMEKKVGLANNMVAALSKFLRYSLDIDPMQKVSLAKEVEAMELYLGIEKVRFEERLKLDFKLEEQADEALIPSMLLQPLIENSIKYAIARNENGGTIRLHATVFGGDLIMELSDDGEGVELEGDGLPTGSGVGLTNTQERLRQLYGEDHACTFSKAEPQGLKISIRIPYETETRAAA